MTVGDSGTELVAVFGRLPVPGFQVGIRVGEPVMIGIRPSDLHLASKSETSVGGAVRRLEPLNASIHYL
jgi:hypothetical protein